MIALLNYLPYALIAIGAYLVYRSVLAKKYQTAAWHAFVTICLVILLNSLTPSYMPKGTVRDNTVPAFEPSQAEIQNRLREPVPEAEQRKALEDKLDWEQKVEESKTETAKTE